MDTDLSVAMSHNNSSLLRAILSATAWYSGVPTLRGVSSASSCSRSNISGGSWSCCLPVAPPHASAAPANKQGYVYFLFAYFHIFALPTLKWLNFTFLDKIKNNITVYMYNSLVYQMTELEVTSGLCRYVMGFAKKGGTNSYTIIVRFCI